MKEAKGGGRNVQEGIGGRKKEESYRRLGPAAASESILLVQDSPTACLGLTSYLHDGSQQDQKEQ